MMDMRISTHTPSRTETGAEMEVSSKCATCAWQGPMEPTIVGAFLDLHRALHPLALHFAWTLVGPILRRLPWT